MSRARTRRTEARHAAKVTAVSLPLLAVALTLTSCSSTPPQAPGSTASTDATSMNATGMNATGMDTDGPATGTTVAQEPGTSNPRMPTASSTPAPGSAPAESPGSLAQQPISGTLAGIVLPLRCQLLTPVQETPAQQAAGTPGTTTLPAQHAVIGCRGAWDGTQAEVSAALQRAGWSASSGQGALTAVSPDASTWLLLRPVNDPTLGLVILASVATWNPQGNIPTPASP